MVPARKCVENVKYSANIQQQTAVLESQYSMAGNRDERCAESKITEDGEDTGKKDDFDDTEHSCKGCGGILWEGKAFEAAGHMWHPSCFRCNTCLTALG